MPSLWHSTVVISGRLSWRAPGWHASSQPFLARLGGRLLLCQHGRPAGRLWEQMRTHTHIRTHTNICAHMCTHTRAHTHAHVRARMRAHAHAHTCTRTSARPADWLAGCRCGGSLTCRCTRTPTRTPPSCSPPCCCPSATLRGKSGLATSRRPALPSTREWRSWGAGRCRSTAAGRPHSAHQPALPCQLCPVHATEDPAMHNAAQADCASKLAWGHMHLGTSRFACDA